MTDASNTDKSSSDRDVLTIDELANRRQYFRIHDKALVEVCPLQDHQTVAECFDISPEFNLISEFQLLDVEAKHLLRSITERDKNLGQFLRIMNKKLDTLSRVVALSHQEKVALSHQEKAALSHQETAAPQPQTDPSQNTQSSPASSVLTSEPLTSELRKINLSEGGLAIESGVEYKDQQRVAIKLILLPSYSGLLLEGRILSCLGSAAPYELHIAFSEISEAHQQLIARHIMRLQSQAKSPHSQES